MPGSALAELRLKMTLLLLTKARKDCNLGFFECFSLPIKSVASPTGLLSGNTNVGFVLSLIQYNMSARRVTGTTALH